MPRATRSSNGGGRGPSPGGLMNAVDGGRVGGNSCDVTVTTIFVIVIIIVGVVINTVPSGCSRLSMDSSGLCAVNSRAGGMLGTLSGSIAVCRVTTDNSRSSAVSGLLSHCGSRSGRVGIRMGSPIMGPGFTSRCAASSLTSGDLVMIYNSEGGIVGCGSVCSSSMSCGA